MAHFHGTLQGARGEASHLGTKSSGISAMVHGWEGGIKVTMESVNDVDHVRISVGEHGEEHRTVLYFGPITELLSLKGRADLFFDAFKQIMTAA